MTATASCRRSPLWEFTLIGPNPSHTLNLMSPPTGIDRNLTHYADPGFSRYIRRAFLASAGYDEADLERPVVGIADTSSDYTTCHRVMPQLVEAVKRGVLEAGGLPLVFPTLSLGEILLSPTAMLYRNLMAMATEEMIAAQPMDAVVLLGGCDKTLPAQLMACSFHVRARHPPRRRANASRRLARRALGRMHGLPPLLGTTPGRCAGCRRNRRCRAEPVPNRRNLHGHGHGLNHGLRDRGPRANAAGLSHSARSLRPALAARRRHRPSGRSLSRRRDARHATY